MMPYHRFAVFVCLFVAAVAGEVTGVWWPCSLAAAVYIGICLAEVFWQSLRRDA